MKDTRRDTRREQEKATTENENTFKELTFTGKFW